MIVKRRDMDWDRVVVMWAAGVQEQVDDKEIGLYKKRNLLRSRGYQVYMNPGLYRNGTGGLEYEHLLSAVFVFLGRRTMITIDSEFFSWEIF